MNLLAIDTATEACSAAVLTNGEVLHRYTVAPQQHAKLLLPMIDELMAEAGLTPSLLDGLVFGQGPGSFTGVRIAASTAQAIAFAADCGVVCVSTLQALAHRAFREYDLNDCVAVIDARMQQVYWGAYRTLSTGDSLLLEQDRVSDPDQMAVSAITEMGQWTCAGSGAGVYADVLRANGFQSREELAGLFPTATDMISLALPRFDRGEAVSAEHALPVYLRDNVALTLEQQAKQKK